VAVALLTQLFASVPVTIYPPLPVLFRFIAVAVEPVDHTYDTAPVPVSVVLDPLQIVASPVIATAGSGFTVTAAVAKLLQLFASVPVTVYPALAVGATVIVVAVEPVDHAYVTAPEPLSVTEDPAHMVPEVGVTLTTGGELTVTVVVAVFTQLFASVPVNV